jgi:hypothetical protein
MADDSSKSPPNRTRVDVDQPQDRRYWAHKFGVTEDELRKAVDTVGPKAALVERCLRTSG